MAWQTTMIGDQRAMTGIEGKQEGRDADASQRAQHEVNRPAPDVGGGQGRHQRRDGDRCPEGMADVKGKGKQPCRKHTERGGRDQDQMTPVVEIGVARGDASMPSVGLRFIRRSPEGN